MKISIFKYLALLITILLLIATLRGVLGNPTPRQITENLTKETMPFELSPERGRYALTMSIAENKTFYFSDEIAKFVVPDLGYIDGRFVSIFAPGVSFIAVPFYVLGKMFNLAQLSVFSVSSLFALANVFLIYTIGKRLTGNSYAGIVAGMTFLFASNAWSYATVLYQHHITTFLILLAFLLLLEKPNFLTAFNVCLLFGISVFVEYPNAIFFIPLMFLLMTRYTNIRNLQNKVYISIKTPIFLGIFGLAISFWINLWYNNAAYGDPFRLSGTLETIREVHQDPNTGRLISSQKQFATRSPASFFVLENLPNSMSVLLTSKERGVVWFSPVLLLGLLGFMPLYRKKKDLALALFATGILILLLYGMWGDPWGGWAFGPRYLIPLFSILAILLSIAIYENRRKIIFSVAFLLTLVYSVFVNLSGALTTLQIPPSIEADAVRYPEIKFIYTINLINNGKTSSFLYNTFLSEFISLKHYAVTLFALTTIFITGVYLISIKELPKN